MTSTVGAYLPAHGQTAQYADREENKSQAEGQATVVLY